MKNLMFLFVCVACLLTNAAACTTSDNPQPDQTITVWDRYNVGSVLFEDKAPETAGSDIYRRIIPRPENYIKEQARAVLATLYTSPKDSIPRVYQIHYTLEDIEGVSAKSDGNGGVLLHELTHAYQLEPQGVGSYGDSPTFRAFIEGMADAVRIANGGFEGPSARPKGGSYMDGYRTTGYFLVWLRDHKDAEFLRKFNRSALKVVPWSFDGAVKHILGQDCNIDQLWREYQIAVGDIQP